MNASMRCSSPRARRGFTLTELLVAVGVLVVVIVATGRIFGTVTRVNSVGQANSDLLSEAAAIEKQFRRDIERLCYQGVLGIRNVSVANDVNGSVLLNPELPASARIRCDQLVFFANGVEGTQVFVPGKDSRHKPQAAIAKVFYSHAYQLSTNSGVDPFDGVTSNGVYLQPWAFELGNTSLDTCVFDNDIVNYGTAAASNISVTQLAAPSWLFVRQTAMMGDDWTGLTNSAYDYLDAQAKMAPTMWETVSGAIRPHRALTNSRVDGTATHINDFRQFIEMSDPLTNTFYTWANQRDRISRCFLGRFSGGTATPPLSPAIYPRATRISSSADRIDHAQTTPVLSSGCSSFIVDWTYENGVGGGTFTNALGTVGSIPGMTIYPFVEQPWFGLTDDDRAVAPLATPTSARPYNWGPALSYTSPAGTHASFADGIAPLIDPTNIEGPATGAGSLPEFTPIGQPGVRMYEAIFGFNQNRGLAANGAPDYSLGYTPWPSAIRITMTLHDARAKIEKGRTFQFVVELPKRNF